MVERGGEDQLVAIFSQPLHQILGRLDVHVNGDPGRHVVEIGKGPGEIQRRVRPHRIHGSEMELADHLTPGGANGASKVLDGAEQRASCRKYVAPFVGQGEAATAPFAQTKTQTALQTGKLIADCRLCNAEVPLGRGESPIARHRLEYPQQSQIDILEVGQRGWSRHGH